MEYKLLFKKGDYSLIKRGSKMQQYAVVFGLNEGRGDWACTVCYSDFGDFSPTTEIEALQDMIEVFRFKTEPNYIPRYRLEELATQFKDGLIEDDEESAMEYFDEVCEMTDEEKAFFGIGTDEDDYIPSATNGDYSPSNPWDAPGMSIDDFL